jgi:hypothetical protein
MKAKKKKIDTYQAEDFGIDLEVSFYLFIISLLLLNYKETTNTFQFGSFSNIAEEQGIGSFRTTCKEGGYIC